MNRNPFSFIHALLIAFLTYVFAVAATPDPSPGKSEPTVAKEHFECVISRDLNRTREIEQLEAQIVLLQSIENTLTDRIRQIRSSQ